MITNRGFVCFFGYLCTFKTVGDIRTFDKLIFVLFYVSVEFWFIFMKESAVVAPLKDIICIYLTSASDSGLR